MGTEQIQLIFLALFIIFFIGAGVAIFLRDRFHARRGFVAGLLSALLVAGLVGLAPLPITDLHKFSGAGPEHGEYYHIYVVDEGGNELRYDPRAVEPILNTRLDSFAEQLVTERSAAEREEAAAFLLEHAQEYRREAATEPSVRTYAEFPRHERDYSWHDEDLGSYGAFSGLKIYHFEYQTTSDGTDVIGHSSTVVYEYEGDQ